METDSTDCDVFVHRLKILTDDEKQRLEAQNSRLIPEAKAQKLEREAKRHWDIFYKRNETKFFRDRHWTTREFQELINFDPEQKIVFLELGCGVGNMLYPLVEEGFDNFFFYACDFSPRAIDFVKANVLYDPSKMSVFCADLTTEDLFENVPECSVDIASLIFVLSAIQPACWAQVAKNAFRALRPGGILLFRDYGRYDMAQLRFKAGHKIAENFYMRQDGTRSYYFTEEELADVFTTAGFQVLENSYVQRRTVNFKEGVDVPRIFVQGKYKKATVAVEATKWSRFPGPTAAVALRTGILPLPARARPLKAPAAVTLREYISLIVGRAVTDRLPSRLSDLNSLHRASRRRSSREAQEDAQGAADTGGAARGQLGLAHADDAESDAGDVEELPPIPMQELNGDGINHLAKEDLLAQSDSSSSHNENEKANGSEGDKKDDSDEEDNVKSRRRKPTAISSDSEAGSARRKDKISDFEESDEDSEPRSKSKRKKSSDSDGSQSSNDGSKKKRCRIKQVRDSDGSGSDTENEGKKHGRKNIRKVMSKDQLEEATKKAARREKERVARIADRQKTYNNVDVDESGKPDEVVLEKVVLDFDPETKEPLIQVDRGLVRKLKPHQANGIKFMWNACFESVKRIKKDRGSGCILAHCMGLGKTLQRRKIHCLVSMRQSDRYYIILVRDKWCLECCRHRYGEENL